MVNIERIQMKHLPQLAGLYEELVGVSTNLTKMEETYQTLLEDKSYYVLGAFYENELAGSVMGILCKDLIGECEPFMVIENVVVSSRIRRQGIGRKLMSEIEVIARQQGCIYIILVSGGQRVEAHRMYESMGYREEHVEGFRKFLK
ncbi:MULTISPECIES: GNAT family N-acetyltransferase [unclassified Paenibacillus]|uniref:GNAT family N-acetyltransferase n=1 Tax=Paenibacillus provencensis TaxID=441151 RepID=A0ABW3PXV9_9BACL|nr:MULTISPECIES: GNAT family N-acetyltransferase [unclassified Paenibacillus]MCM3128913.1 GNAT family N-acetyltransferase [Paenibacillus sp. MER 78]SFS50082.1 Ribosomal protein S18 acetylase RimI [Paenibacillus sp. 453mf]